jgi:hypothetical protein
LESRILSEYQELLDAFGEYIVDTLSPEGILDYGIDLKDSIDPL